MSSTDRRDQIATVADSAYAAMGVTDRKVTFGYERTVSAGCAKPLSIEPGEYDYNALFDADLSLFPATGSTIQDYGGPSRSRALTALKDDVGVIVAVPPLAVTATAGPCGRDLTAVGDRYQPVSR